VESVIDVLDQEPDEDNDSELKFENRYLEGEFRCNKAVIDLLESVRRAILFLAVNFGSLANFHDLFWSSVDHPVLE